MDFLDKLLADAIQGGANSAQSDSKIRELDSENREQKRENERLERENEAAKEEKQEYENRYNDAARKSRINNIRAVQLQKLLNQPPVAIASKHKGFAESWEDQQRCLSTALALMTAFKDLACEYGTKLNIENRSTMERGYDGAIALADNYHSNPILKGFIQGGENVFQDKRIDGIKEKLKNWKSNSPALKSK